MVERNGHYPFNPEPSSPVNHIQRLHLELIRLSGFNDFDGQQVATDLERHPELWRAVMLGNFGKRAELLALRDMSRGFYNADTLMVLTDHEQAPALEELAWRWSAKEVGWLGDAAAGAALGVSPMENRQVLRVWWD